MFEKFLQKKRIEAIAQTPMGKMLDQVALATAVAQITGDYVRSRNGVPILKDEDASVVEMWSGVRLEAISQLWGPGPISVELIIDPAKHPNLAPDAQGVRAFDRRECERPDGPMGRSRRRTSAIVNLVSCGGIVA